MATPIINQFSQFQLTDPEQLAGQVLSQNQLMVLQNLRAEYAVKKINLNYTPTEHQAYLQQEAEISGWLACLGYIMECHQVASEIIASGGSNSEGESTSDV